MTYTRPRTADLPTRAGYAADVGCTVAAHPRAVSIPGGKTGWTCAGCGATRYLTSRTVNLTGRRIPPGPASILWHRPTTN